MRLCGALGICGVFLTLFTHGSGEPPCAQAHCWTAGKRAKRGRWYRFTILSGSEAILVMF